MYQHTHYCSPLRCFSNELCQYGNKRLIRMFYLRITDNNCNNDVDDLSDECPADFLRLFSIDAKGTGASFY